MQPSRYITPRLGGKTLIVVCVWALVSAAIPVSVDPDAFFPLSWQALARLGCLMGITFGFGSGLTWMATVLRNPSIRVVLRILIVVVFGYLLSFLGTADWIRHAVNLAGLLIVQSMLFSWWRVPDWAMPARSSNASQLARGQFQIADLLAATTAFACLLGLVIRYVAPVESGLYWSVMFLMWGVTPMIAACFSLAALAHWPGQARLRVLSGVVLSCLLAAAMSYAQDYVSRPSILDGLAVPCFYGLFFISYGATMFFFAFAGRVQTLAQQSEPEAGSGL